jgi:hypothetical protein
LMEENYQKGLDLIMTYEDTGIFSEDDNDVVYTNRVTWISSAFILL